MKKSVFLTAFLGLYGLALAGKPEITHSLFHNLPSKVHYFTDSEVVLYHDLLEGNVWRSSNQGKSWALIDVSKEKARALVDNSADTQTAYILTPTTTHYITRDRGETWQSFDTPLPPSSGSPNVLSFHAQQPEWVLFTGSKCDKGSWGMRVCHDETFYTKDNFRTTHKLITHSLRCMFAHEKTELSRTVDENLVFCVASQPPSGTDSSTGPGSTRDARLYSTTDYNNWKFVDMGIGKDARGVVGVGGVKKFLVTAMKPPTEGRGGNGEMVLYISQDGDKWGRAQFPQGRGLSENAYTIVESTEHSIIVDVNSAPLHIVPGTPHSGARVMSSGTLFTSNSDGTSFVLSLENTNRGSRGIVDFEAIVNLEGIAVANVISNPDEVTAGMEKAVKTKITFDDGARWSWIKAPREKKLPCDVDDVEFCSLHLHSVTQPHNYGKVFSSPAPGIIMGVGNIGKSLLPYDECDTFISTDGGLNWRMVADDPMKYEFGDQGSLLVMIEDEESTDDVRYSYDFGKTWEKLDIGVHIRARLLTTVPDSTTQQFILLGTLTKSSQKDREEKHVIVHIDFSKLDKRKCGEQDMEKWYARTIGGTPDCLMGHKQWFKRRKEDADCVVADRWNEPEGHEENCDCSDEDYECDFNFALDVDGKTCIPAGPEKIPLGQCRNPDDKFLGSSGYRLIPGNTCTNGIKKDSLIQKSCQAGQETPGLVAHSSFNFPGLIMDQSYFSDSQTILAFSDKRTVWQSNNEGLTWQKVTEDQVLSMTMHPYFKERAFLVTNQQTVRYTTNKGERWESFRVPSAPGNIGGITHLDFHPTQPGWIIWTGTEDCESLTSNRCRAVAHYSKDNGRKWYKIDDYVRVCSWGRDKRFKISEEIIFCESYRDKKGNQRSFSSNMNPIQLVIGTSFYSGKHVVMNSIVGFATIEQYMVVAELLDSSNAIALRVSLNGDAFATAKFPLGMEIGNRAYTVLDSSTDSIFLHVTTHGSDWGSLFKSNSNGTYYNLALDYVNRNGRGFIDFEKMLGLHGIAVVNIVSNPKEAVLSGNKKLQSRITHNDGGRWQPLSPPSHDSLGQKFDCASVGCSLHIHGYTERRDTRATYSSPSAIGLMMAVGNVGESLLPYRDSDTFLTRDGGFHWEEIHKDAHMWEFGDQGSILVLINDEEPTDHVTYSLNQGLTWQDYNFGQRIRAQTIQTVPADTSRKFIIFGVDPSQTDASIAIHLDFSGITNIKCNLDTANPNNDDFELWSPSENRDEQCLFGQQTLYHRRIRDRNCYVGTKIIQPHKIEKTCACQRDDFECEYNYKLDEQGDCVLVEGASPLGDDKTCSVDQTFWYERTPYRKIPQSKCQGGLTLDQGAGHTCAGVLSHSWFFWASISLSPFLIAGLAAVWWTRRRGGKGRIRLPEPGDHGRGSFVDTVISIPWFLIGLTALVVDRLREVELPFLGDRLRRRSSRNGYRTLRLDDDAELLQDYDSDDN